VSRMKIWMQLMMMQYLANASVACAGARREHIR
jgi:hypothetical protein